MGIRRIVGVLSGHSEILEHSMEVSLFVDEARYPMPLDTVGTRMKDMTFQVVAVAALPSYSPILQTLTVDFLKPNAPHGSQAIKSYKQVSISPPLSGSPPNPHPPKI